MITSRGDRCSVPTRSSRAWCWACSCVLPAGLCSSHSGFIPVGVASESIQHPLVLFDTQLCFSAKIPTDVARGWWSHRAFQKVPKKLWISLRKQCNNLLIDILLPPHFPVLKLSKLAEKTFKRIYQYGFSFKIVVTNRADTLSVTWMKLLIKGRLQNSPWLQNCNTNLQRK